MRAFISFILAGLFCFSAPSLAAFNSNTIFADNSPAFGNSDSEFVTVDQAFAFFANQADDVLFLDWEVLDGYYLYQDRLSVTIQNGEIGPLEMAEGTPYQDEFFGQVKIYTEPLHIRVPIIAAEERAQLIVQYQGCAKAGFCYPPETRTVALSPVTRSNNGTPSLPAATPTAEKPATATQPQPVAAPQSREASLAGSLQDNRWTPLLFLALGIGLAFTPCVFPMYPILTGIVLGGGKLSHSRALSLSLIYVQGMALTYTLLGLVVASAGLQFQAALQHPYVLIAISILFVLLALSMFGLYTLQLPSAVQTWLNSQSNRQQGGNLSGVFIMGVISGLVCSPCTTAPLSGALLYVAQSGDLLTGGVALYALGLGMGIPLMAVAVFGNRLLPKAGAWMDRVKVLFGFILLAAPIFFIERLIPPGWAVTLWGLLGLATFGWLYHVKNSLEFGGWKQSLVGVIAVLGIVGSVMPVYNQWFGNPSSAAYQPQLSFTRIASVSELEQQLNAARQAGKPVMLDFYADWCVACKEFEKYTFHTPQVEARLKDFVLLQADVTRNTPADIALYEKLNVMGLPTIDFWDSQGNYLQQARLTGFLEAEPFLAHLDEQELR